jgi:hypothetical protein
VDRRINSEIDKQWSKSARQRIEEIRSGKVKPVSEELVFEKIWQTFDNTLSKPRITILSVGR